MESMSRVRVFIGSSTESLPVARGLKANLEEHAEVRIWDEDLFTPGRYTLEELLDVTASFDFAIFVWTGDDSVHSRGLQFTSPRDNVILEAGLFYGRLGRDRVFLCAAKGSSVKTPSDLLGLKILSFQEPSDANYRAATGSAAAVIVSRVAALGSLRKATPQVATAPSTDIYPSFIAARHDIAEACRHARDVKVLSNKGLAFFGLDDSIVSIAEIADYAKLQRIHVLLMHVESPWINRGLIELRHYESIESYKKELAASHAIVESSMARLRSITELSRGEIKYHVAEPCFRIVMTEEVAFVSSYAEHPSIQVRDIPVFVCKAEQGSLHGAFQRYFNDVWHNSSHTGTRSPGGRQSPAVSAGGIVFATVHGSDYVALVQRDDGGWVLPKGHRSRGEDLRATAVREVSEETGLERSSLLVQEKLDAYASDETGEMYDEQKVVHFFVMRYSGDKLPSLAADIDHRDARWWNTAAELPYIHYAYQRTLVAETVERVTGDVVRFRS
jgi:8-oxo-dGTP pyrophosphatase MutT (NUDIX family)